MPNGTPRTAWQAQRAIMLFSGFDTANFKAGYGPSHSEDSSHHHHLDECGSSGIAIGSLDLQLPVAVSSLDVSVPGDGVFESGSLKPAILTSI